MKLYLTFILSLLLLESPAQIQVILDTDPGYDPDDVGCMAMLHSMASQGECEILAIINSTDQKESPLCISAINEFFNRSAIPVGDYKNYPGKVDAPENAYNYYIAATFPRTLKSWEEAAESVSLYREILSSAEDTSITIVIIGTMHNFHGLLQSESCQFSDLPGIELVREKVRQVVTMGGNFINGKGYDRTNWGGADALCSYTSWSCLNRERNDMCRFVIANCPAPFIASGWEVGCGDYHNANYGNVMTGQGLKKLDPGHVALQSYEYHFRFRGGDQRISRHSNDQCALLYAIRGEGENFRAWLNGDINLSEKGECSWKASSDMRQGFIQKKRHKDQIAAEIEALMMAEPMNEDQSPPTPPSDLQISKVNEGIRLSWEKSSDPTIGSWVVSYNVYRNGTFLGNAFGTRFLDPQGSENARYMVRAVNVNGLLSYISLD